MPHREVSVKKLVFCDEWILKHFFKSTHTPHRSACEIAAADAYLIVFLIWYDNCIFSIFSNVLSNHCLPKHTFTGTGSIIGSGETIGWLERYCQTPAAQQARHAGAHLLNLTAVVMSKVQIIMIIDFVMTTMLLCSMCVGEGASAFTLCI